MVEKMSLGASLTLVGLVTVFFVLFLLQMVMKAQEKLFTKWLSIETKTNAEMKQIDNSSSKNGHHIFNEQNPEVEVSMITPEIVAVITAAIASYTENQKQSFRVVSVRKVWDKEASHSWTLKGQQDLINSRSNL